MNDYATDPMLAAMRNERLVEENEALRRENDRLWEKGNRIRFLLNQAMPLLAAHGTAPEWLSPDERKRWESEWEWLSSEYRTMDGPPVRQEV